MKEWTVKFWTPGSGPGDDGATFGCAVHGLATPERWAGPEERAAAAWGTRLPGELLAGAYGEVLEGLKRLSFKPAAAVALFPRNRGIEDFLAGFRAALGETPMAGGAAALGKGQEAGEVIPRAGDAAVLLVGGGAWRVEATNAHDERGLEVEVARGGKRVIEKVRAARGGAWVDGLRYYRSLQEEGGVPPDDFERLTFSDLSGRNVHCSVRDGRLGTGADLPAEGPLVLRETDGGRVTARVERWMAAERALVFCCAGLRRLVERPLLAGKGSLAGFMFGELVTLAGKPAFGNLMLARVRAPAGT